MKAHKCRYENFRIYSSLYSKKIKKLKNKTKTKSKYS